MNIESLARALPKEQARVRIILGHYQELGQVGAFGAAFIERDLQLADEASASGDVVAMIAAYQNLKQTEK